MEQEQLGSASYGAAGWGAGRGGRGRLAVGLTLSYAAMVSLAIAVNLIPVFLTTLGADLGGLSNEKLGRIGAVTFAGLVTAILVTGPLADRWGAKVFAVGGNVLIGLGLAVLGVAPGYWAVLVWVYVMGFGAGALDMVLSPIVAALQPERRTAAMNWLHSFYCVGAVLTILVGSLALWAGLPWRQLSLGLIAMPAVVGAGFVWMKLPPLVAEGQERTPLRVLCRRGWFLAALVAIFLGGATELGMAQWLPAYAEKALGYSKWTGGMALMWFSIAMAVGRMGAGMLGHRVSAFGLMLGCCWASVGLFLVACFSPVASVALAGCILAGLAGSCLWPSMLAVTADRYPHGGASMYGLLAALGNLGGIFMPWVVGVSADRVGMHWGLATATLCPLLMGVLLVGMKGRAGAVRGPQDEGAEVGGVVV